MKIFLTVASCLLAVPALGQTNFGQQHQQNTQCKGVVHGEVIGQDGKPWGGISLILEPVGDYDYMLPSTKTYQRGQYRFSDVPCGSWRVFVEDEKAGYPHSGSLMNLFLYGGSSPAVTITPENLDSQLVVNAPPRPGQIIVHLTNSKTKARIPRFEIYMKVTRKRSLRTSCEDSVSSSCNDHAFLIPPDQDVKLYVTSKGFHGWKDAKGRARSIHVRAGEVITVEAALKPVTG